MIADRAGFFEGKQQSERFAQAFVDLAKKYPKENVTVSMQLEPGTSRTKRWLQLCFQSATGSVLVSEPMSSEAGPDEVLALVKRHMQAFAAS